MANYKIELSRKDRTVRLTRQDIHKTIKLNRSNRHITIRSSGLRGLRGDDGAGPEDLASVAFSGEYDDLLNLPTIPDVSTKAEASYVDSQDSAVAGAAQSALTGHTSRTDNPHSVTKSQVGLGNVDNTADTAKPVSTATQAALDTKVDKVSGKGLSTEDYTTSEKTKLSNIAAGATQNASDASLRDRTTHTGSQPISTVTGLQTALDAKADSAGLATVATSGSYDDLSDKPTIPDTSGLVPNTRTVNGHALSSNITVTKGDVGLGNVDNTSDASKPVSAAQQTALNGKQPIFMTGTISTSSATAAKTVTLDSPWSSLIPTAGDFFLLTFTLGSSASSSTIAINGTTARAVRTTSGQSSATHVSIEANATVLFRFDGTYMRFIGVPTNTTYTTISSAEIDAGTSTSARLMTPQLLEYALTQEASKTRTLSLNPPSSRMSVG